MEGVDIRACILNDIDRVIALERQWEQEAIAYGDFNPLSRETYLSTLECFPAYFLVAESDGQLVGYIHASVQRNNPVEIIPAHEPYVEIEDIYVQPDFRDRDIGGALLEQIFEIARQEGIERFVVGTRSKETDKILKLARCARAAAPQRSERSPTLRAHQMWHLSRPAPARGGKAHDHHIRHRSFMPAP